MKSNAVISRILFRQPLGLDVLRLKVQLDQMKLIKCDGMIGGVVPRTFRDFPRVAIKI